jgi:hypothetical protein
MKGQLATVDRAVRRAVNPFSTAFTLVVQSPRRRGRAVAGASVAPWRPPHEPGDDGGAGVHEPWRPLPTVPSDSMSLELPRN